ncbi:hypothetical protein [Cryobacterium sp. Y29]|uniref:hypothetical protein n=1 Tax=Cryobacterium sp. Y29 TaxID=2048285 RepID=UPI0011B01A71|nr:hypothetical protein [Cryobacterium sp. Y29]
MLILSSISNSLYTVAVQGLALATLLPAEFGIFSLVYLFFGLSLSFSHSTLIDVWVRSPKVAWAEYGSVLFWLSTAISWLGFAVALTVSSSVIEAAFIGLGLGAGVYRNGARFYSARSLKWGRVIAPDIFGLVILLFSFYILSMSQNNFTSVLVAWSLSLAISAASSKRAIITNPKGMQAWLSRHKKLIKPLWLDSSLLDISVILTPIMMSAFMSAASFGLYRSISSAALPVRLLLSPLRPNISSLSPDFLLRGKHLTAVVGTGALVALGISLVLVGISVLGVLPESILPKVADYAIPAGIFAFGTLISNVYYISARSHANLRSVNLGRVVETILMVAGPVIGLIFNGISGAIWAFAICAALTGASWLYILLRENHHPKY